MGSSHPGIYTIVLYWAWIYVTCLMTSSGDAQQTAQVSFHVRLEGNSNTSRPGSGRVMVSKNGEDSWGMVCNSGVDAAAATAICREMFYTYGKADSWEKYGAATGLILLDGVKCTGTESSLSACKHAAWGQHNCTHQQAAAVTCFNTTVRLIQPNTLPWGYIDLLDSESALPICAAGFGDSDAQVACRELGYAGGSALHNTSLSFPPPASSGYLGTLALSELQCVGNETSLRLCPMKQATRGCMDRAMMICQDKIQNVSTNPVIELTSKPAGFLTIKGPGELKVTVCRGSGYGPAEANCTCRSLGYQTGALMRVSLGSLPSDLEALSGVRTSWKFGCNGTEASLGECPGIPDRSVNRKECSWRKDSTEDYLSVVCSNQVIRSQLYQASNTSLPNEGLVQLSYDGEWGVICDPNWNHRNAEVACRHMGYVGGAALKWQGQAPTNKVYLGQLKCSGLETDLLNCSSQGWKQYDNKVCTDPANYAAVRCYDKVRLGPLRTYSPGYGSVQIWKDDKWSLVCGSGFGVKEADVLCRELGYTTGTVPRLDYRLWLGTDVGFQWFKCQGNETKLTDCSYSNETRCPMSNLNHANVYCYNGHIADESYVALDSVDVAPDYVNVTGAVKFVRDGLLSRVCIDDWNDAEANVTCKQLNFKGGVAMTYKSTLTQVPVTFAGLACYGNETRLNQCSHSPLLGSACTATAGVLCYNSTGIKLMTVRGSGNKSRSAGFVIIEYDGRKGHICEQPAFWTREDARVICRQRGFVDGDKKLPDPTGAPMIAQSTPGVLQAPRCSGDEDSIFMCANTGWNTTITSRCAPVAVTCYNNVRLSPTAEHMDLPNQLEVSKVQVFQNNEWGGVCGTDFGDNEALVVCREVGYTYGTAINPGHLKGQYVASNYKMWLRRVKCVGNETSLMDCTLDKSTSTFCKSNTYNWATTLCSNTPIDTTISASPSTSISGPVKILRYGIEGKACAKYWDDNSANVFCRENGFTGGVAMAYNTYSRETTWLLKYQCYGNESALADCRKEDSIDFRCTNTKDVGALCFTLDVQYAIRGATKGKGWVEITHDGLPGSVCSYGWSNTDAGVFCKSLNYMDGQKIRATAEEIGAEEPQTQYISDVSCQGGEKTLLQCGSRGWRTLASATHCGIGHSAAVECFYAVRIRDGNAIGAVQAYFNHRWGYICDKDWDDTDAKVMCLQMGYTNAKAFPCFLMGRQTSYYSYVWNNVKCDGTETSLSDCEYEERMYLSCPTSTYASVMCYDELPKATDLDYRLLGSTYPNVGVVGIKYAEMWGRVCVNGWDDNSASVVCRSLQKGPKGFAYRTASRSVAGQPYWLNNLKCTGNEVTLTECEHSEFGETCGCDVSVSAGVYCYTNTGFEMRLADGEANYGRVEVAVDGRWGTICDYGFNDEDANVVCRMMNFTSGTKHNMPPAKSRGSGPIWITNVICKGNETSLLDCGLTGWDLDRLTRTEGTWTWSCPSSHTRDAAVYCFGNVRLQDGISQDFGRLEINLNDKWYQVCDDGSFDDAAATVVCKQLGYNTGKSFCCSALGSPGSRSAYETTTLTSFKCTGNETDIRDCTYTNGTTCTVKEYISVACSNRSENATNEMRMSLRSPNNLKYTGQLVLDIGGVKGRVCSDLWDDQDANVACRSLGYKGGRAYVVSSRSTTPFFIGKVNCTGNETSLSDCPHSPVGSRTGCVSSDYDAGVLCYNTTGIQFRMTGGNDQYGKVEIQRDGEWGTVCSYGWGTTESKVFCKQMGFLDGATHRVSSYVSIDKDMFISFVNCRGSEKNILECRNQGWRNVPSYCRRYYSPAYVYCFRDIRLNSLSSYPTSQGAVEMYKNDEWSVVCDDDWDEKDAQVVCRQLGHPTGFAACCNAYGYYYKDAVITNVTCTGNETELTDCQYDRVPTGTRCNYASAICVNTTVNTDYQLSISTSGGSQYTGRLQVTYAGVKGRICSDGWTNHDAQVACRELNYPYGEAYTHYDSSSSSEAGPWWLGDVNCRGNETKISECEPLPWGRVRSCESAHSAGVLCYTTNGTYFRVVNGYDNSSGRVEISLDGTWGTICDTYWDDRDATALCRQLGFVDGRARFNSAFGKGSGPSWLLRYSCRGREDSLYECPHSGYTRSTYTTCNSHLNDAGVECYSLVRLDSRQSGNRTSGPVLYHHNHTWFSVSDETFNDAAAGVVCRSLGYAFGRSACCSAFGSTYPLYNVSLNCTGRENSVEECELVYNTSSQTYASAFCFANLETINDTAYTFSIEGSDKRHGQLSASLWNRPGRICSDSWDDADAGVYCRSIGYAEGMAYYHYNQPIRGPSHSSPLSREDGPSLNETRLLTRNSRLQSAFLLREFNCTGEETSLLKCPHRNRTNLGMCSTDVGAGVICFQNTSSYIQFRLADGPTEREGRVEVSVDGVWGTVCDITWDNKDASALCRHLGYADGVAKKKSYYGPGNGTALISRVHCNGDEDTILKCPHEGFNSTFGTTYSRSCTQHKDDAGAYCYSNMTIGTEPNKTHGVVRIYAGDQWNLVCADGWSQETALVACRQAGFPDGRAMPPSAFGTPKYNITVPYINCTGTEKSVFECKMGEMDLEPGENSTVCKSGNYASVYCSNETIKDSPFAIRISNDSHSGSYHGLLEIRMNGLWGRICRHKFGKKEAEVACKMMGFAGGAPYQHLAVNFLPVFMSNVTCNGSEDSLMDCNYTKWGDQGVCANHVFEAGVVCYKDPKPGLEYRLGGTNRNSTGRVEINFNGTWGTVCDLGWGVQDAQVVCSQFGYKDGLAMSGSFYGAGTGPVWVQSFSCAGNESSLLQCPNSGWNTTWDVYEFYRCENHGRDASVKCYEEKLTFKEIRLVGSDMKDRGRVEILISPINEWGTICDDSWDDRDATVVCRYFGYQKGDAVGNSRFGQGSGQIWLDEVQCDGNETDFQECGHVGLGKHDCYHFEDAGVICSDPLTTTTISTSTTTTITPSVTTILSSTSTTATTSSTTSSNMTVVPIITKETKTRVSRTSTSTITPSTTSSTKVSSSTTTKATSSATQTKTTEASTSTLQPTSTATPTTTKISSTTTPTTTPTPTTTTTPTTTPTTTTATSTKSTSTTSKTTTSTKATWLPPISTSTTTTATSNTAATTAVGKVTASKNGPPIVAVVVPLLVIFLIAVVVIVAVIYFRQKAKNPFNRQRLRDDANSDLNMDPIPVSLDAAKPNSHHFTNQLYDLAEVDNDIGEIKTAPSTDGAALVDHDFLSDDMDANLNPLYTKLDTHKSSKA